MSGNFKKIDYQRIAQAALCNVDTLMGRWLPDGSQARGSNEWLVSNPKRVDNNPSLSVNMRTGQWADFSIDIAGRDLISLSAYLMDESNSQAALNLAQALGINPYV